MVAQPVIDQIGSAVESIDVSWWEALAAVLVLVAAYPVGRLVHRVVERTFKRLPDVPSILVDDIARFARWFVYLVAVAIALSLVGLEIGWITLVAVVGLVVVVLMLRPVMENTAAGLALTVRPAFTIGDQIKANGERGVVLEIGSHSTVLRTNDGRRVHIPNTQMMGETITVYTAFDARRTEFDISFDGSVDLALALSNIQAALAGAEVIVSDPGPDIVASGFDGDAVSVTARVWYPSSMVSDRKARDAAVRAVNQAIVDAGIALTKTDITVTRIPTEPPGEQTEANS